MNNFLSIYDLDHNLVQSFIKNAVETKNSKSNDDLNFANGKILASIFEKPSTRTRLSFDVAMRKLGGQCIIIDQNKLHLGNNKESISDTAKTLSQYVDIVMYRSQSHETLQKLASISTVPIINGLSDFSHPCQAMADLLTIYEKKFGFEGIKVSWIGPITNVARSWIEIANLNLGIKLKIFSNDYSISEYHKKCEIYKLKPDLDNIEVHNNLTKLDSSDVVITDTWESMGEIVNEKIIKDFSSYTVNQEMMSVFGNECIFMHCLPANRGQEVAPEVIDGPQSVVWDEAQNRLHIQKEIIKWCL